MRMLYIYLPNERERERVILDQVFTLLLYVLTAAQYDGLKNSIFFEPPYMMFRSFFLSNFYEGFKGCVTAVYELFLELS